MSKKPKQSEWPRPAGRCQCASPGCTLTIQAGEKRLCAVEGCKNNVSKACGQVYFARRKTAVRDGFIDPKDADRIVCYVHSDEAVNVLRDKIAAHIEEQGEGRDMVEPKPHASKRKATEDTSASSCTAAAVSTAVAAQVKEHAAEVKELRAQLAREQTELRKAQRNLAKAQSSGRTRSMRYKLTAMHCTSR